MCMSPHEMTSASIEESITYLEGLAKRYPPGHGWRRIYGARIDNIRAILKERAEDGSYHDDTGRY